MKKNTLDVVSVCIVYQCMNGTGLWQSELIIVPRGSVPKKEKKMKYWYGNGSWRRQTETSEGCQQAGLSIL